MIYIFHPLGIDLLWGWIFLFFTKVFSFFTDYLLVAVLLGAGIFLSLRTRLVQIRCLGEGLKNMFSGLFSKEKKNGISPFSALCTSLAAQLGTGNIVGAGAAVLTGGPGAVFWIWLSAFFGMATAYCEGVLAQKTKIRTPSGEYTGGAAYYIKKTIHGKTGIFLSGAFSLFSVCALGFTGVAVQSNSIAVALSEGLRIPAVISGILLTVFAGIIITKGTKAVTRFSEITVPFLAAVYFSVCMLVLLINIGKLPEAFSLIFRCAFSSEAVSGFISGISLKTIISQGIKKGLFTNEAGMGSCACAHAISDAPSPHYQGTMALAGVFTDTFVMMTLTALSVITVLFTENNTPPYAASGSQAVILTFSTVLGEKGATVFTCISILFFAFASIIGWNLFGKSSSIFLFGEKSTRLYTAASLIFIMLGTLFPSDTVWQLTDIFNTFMVLTNITALIHHNAASVPFNVKL